MEHNPGAVILSTDDYFTCTGYYQFDPGALAEAHEWNHKRGKDRILTRLYAGLAIYRSFFLHQTSLPTEKNFKIDHIIVASALIVYSGNQAEHEHSTKKLLK